MFQITTRNIFVPLENPGHQHKVNFTRNNSGKQDCQRHPQRDPVNLNIQRGYKPGNWVGEQNIHVTYRGREEAGVGLLIDRYFSLNGC